MRNKIEELQRKIEHLESENQLLVIKSSENNNSE